MRWLINIYTGLFIYFLPVFSQSWHIVNSPTHQNLARLDMVSPKLGWAVSYDGLILRYNGNSWEISDSLNHIEETSSPRGDSLGGNSYPWGDIYTIRMTGSNRGWIAINNIDNRYYHLIEYDGQSWRYRADAFPLKIRALDFWNNRQGIAVGEGGAFEYRGQQWLVEPLPISLDFRAVKFVSADQIFIAGENGAVLQKTQYWAVLKSPTSALLRDMDFISPDEGWFVGNGGTILHYKSGELFSTTSPTTLDIWAIDMLSENSGFAVGKSGLILQYNGDTWQQIEALTQADLHDIEMVDKKNGWIVAGRGVILQYGKNPLAEIKQDPHRFLFQDQVYLGTRHLMDLIDDVQGVTVADFNNDHLPDIYFTCLRSLNHLLLNRGKGYYSDFTIESGTGGDIESRVGKRKTESGSLAADFDRDGDTDIFLAGKRGTTRLLANNGKAAFEDKSTLAGLPENLNITAGSLADVNEDGYPDLILADEFAGLRLFLNQKYNRFQEAYLDSLALPKTGIRALAVTDFNGDHHTDIAIFFQQSSPAVLFNNGNARWQKDNRPFLATSISNFVSAACVADFNNDGANDLFLCSENGQDALLLYNPNTQQFSDASNIWGVRREGRSYSAAAGDYDLDGDTDLFVSRIGADFLYRNENHQRFTEIASTSMYSKSGYLSGYNTGAANADIDADGDLDLIVGNFDYWSSLLENTRNGSNYITLDLRGVEDTREALGAKIWVWPSQTAYSPEALVAFRELNPSTGLFSQNWSVTHIGLGNHQPVNIRIRFLNGQEEVLENIVPGTDLVIHQSNPSVQLAYGTGRAILQFLNIPFIPFELFKFFIFMIVIILSVRFIENRYQWRPTHIVIYSLVLVAIYTTLAFVLPRSNGILYHTLPFGMILFTLAALISVNEPIRKTNLRQKQIQEKLHQASNALSRIDAVEEAIDIAVKTLHLILPYRFLVLYTYHANGTYFLCKKAINIQLQTAHRKVTLTSQQIVRLQQANSPAGQNELPQFWPALPAFKEKDILLFPLKQENEIFGILILSPKAPEFTLDQQTISTIDYLFLQLTITMKNIRIVREMRDQETLAAIGTFSSGIIHNLKNPVDGLRMMIEVLYHDTPPDGARYEYIRELYLGVLKLKETLLQSFDVVHQPGSLGETAAINDLIREIDTYFTQLNYPALRLELDENIHAVNGNQPQLKLALENIIENALEASGFLQPVTVRTSLNTRENVIEIDIIDNGSGIPVEHLDKIFDMFYSTRGKNRGLGLTITRNIIKNHNGFIRMNSEVEIGTHFTIILPAEIGEEKTKLFDMAERQL